MVAGAGEGSSGLPAREYKPCRRLLLAAFAPAVVDVDVGAPLDPTGHSTPRWGPKL